MIPNSRIPFIYVDFDNSRAIQTGGNQTYKVLLVGQQKTAGPIAAPVQIRTEKDVTDAFGEGSQLLRMAKVFFANNTSSKLYAVALNDAALLPDLIKKIADQHFHLIVNPYTDPVSLKAWDDDLIDRFSASRQLESHLFSSVSGDESTLNAFHLHHSKHFTIMALPKGSDEAVVSAAVAGIVGEQAQLDPARPFNTLPLNKVIAGEEGFEKSIRSRLLDLGFSTLFNDMNGTPRIERLITTYKNPLSETDESYLSLNTLLTLSFLRFSFANYFAAKYPRHKLGNDDAVVRPGSAILTPNTARCETIALFRSWEEQGLVEGFEQFKNELYVERNKKDPGRLDFFMSPRLVSQLNIIGAKVSFLI